MISVSLCRAVSDDKPRRQRDCLLLNEASITKNAAARSAEKSEKCCRHSICRQCSQRNPVMARVNAQNLPRLLFHNHVKAYTGTPVAIACLRSSSLHSCYGNMSRSASRNSTMADPATAPSSPAATPSKCGSSGKFVPRGDFWQGDQA